MKCKNTGLKLIDLEKYLMSFATIRPILTSRIAPETFRKAWNTSFKPVENMINRRISNL